MGPRSMGYGLNCTFSTLKNTCPLDFASSSCHLRPVIWSMLDLIVSFSSSPVEENERTTTRFASPRFETLRMLARGRANLCMVTKQYKWKLQLVIIIATCEMNNVSKKCSTITQNMNLKGIFSFSSKSLRKVPSSFVLFCVISVSCLSY
jgi:hypothetical protein